MTLTTREIVGFRRKRHERASLGGDLGNPAISLEMTGFGPCSEAPGAGLAGLRCPSRMLPSLCLAHPAEGPQSGPKHAHPEDSPTRAK